MPSKYEAILPKLPELPPQDKSWQDKINLIKTSIINDDNYSKAPSDIALAYAALREAKDKVDDQLAMLNLNLEALAQMLIESQNSEDAVEWGTYGVPKTTLKLASGASFRVQREPYTTVEDKEANRKWAIANGLEGLLTIHHQTLNALTNERLLKGEAEPDGVKVFVKTKIVYTKAK